MLTYIIKRIITALLTAFLVATITFFAMNLIPGGPFMAEKAISPQAKAAMEAKFGLDKPLPLQYVTYMKNILHGDLGLSIKKRGRTVSQIISTKFPVSARLGTLAFILAVSCGIPLGALAAFNRGKVLDRFFLIFSTTGIAIPSILLAPLLIYLFSSRINILPAFGLNSPKNYIMPVIALSFNPMVYIGRLMRSSMLDIINQNYIRTARAKGVGQRALLFKHALRNAILPVITYLGPLLASLLTGSFIVEKIFGIPGLGAEFVHAINGRDYPMIMGTTIFLSLLIIFLNLVVDIAYALIDPRIKLQ